MIGQVMAASIGTIAFSLLFGVPEKYYPYCGMVGGVGWLVYSLFSNILSAAEATFIATSLVVILSRIFAVWKRCPVTIFLVSGIFPLVPGAGIYWTAFYIVTNNFEKALYTGFASIKAAFAIVFAIVFVFELPQKVFKVEKRRSI